MYLRRIERYINDYDFEKVMEQIAQMKDRTLDERGRLVKFVLFDQFLNKINFCKESLVEDYEDEDLEKFRDLDWYNIYKKLIDIIKNVDEDLVEADGFNIRLKLFAELVSSLCHYKEIEYDRNDLLDSIIEITKNSNEKYKEDKQELIYHIAEAFINIENFDKAMHFINKNEYEMDREELIINYIEKLIECTKLDDVENIIEEKVKDTSSDYYRLYSDLIETYVDLGDEEKSKELLDKITKSVEKIKNKNEKEVALKYIVVSLVSLKQIDEAVNLANKLSSKTKDEFQINVRDYAFLEIIIGLSKNFEFEKAEELIPKIKNENKIPSAQLHSATSLAESGHYDKAIEIAEEIKDDSLLKEIVIEKIIKILEDNDYNDRADELKKKHNILNGYG